MPSSSGSGSRSAKLAVERLEDRTVPTFLTRAGLGPGLVDGRPFPATGGGLSIAAGDLFPDGLPFGLVENEYVTGTGPGPLGVVRVFTRGGTPLLSFVPFAGFTGGINVAVGDVVGDGTAEIIASVAGNGPPAVSVFNARGQLLSSFFAFDQGFLGGVNITTGNVLGGILAGGYTGGSFSGQFKSEIIIGAAAGTAPHVVATDAAGNYLSSFFAFDAVYRGGVTVAAASIDQTRVPGFTFGIGQSDTNSYDEIIVGAATDTPHLKAFEVWQGTITERLSYFAFDPAIRQGITVAAGSTDNNRGAEIYAAQIAPNGGSVIRAFDAQTGLFLLQFAAFPDTYSRVVNMVVSYVTPPGLGATYDPSDDDTIGGDSFDFNTQDLAVVAGDGVFEQVPRYFIGLPGLPAGATGP